MAKFKTSRSKRPFGTVKHPARPLVTGSFSKRTEIGALRDDDVVGAVILETPEQEQRLDDLKRRVNAEMVRRGMRQG